MEESAQRKERLKAMRMEASQETTSNDAESSSVFHGLSNPLVDTSTAEEHMGSCAPQRFDYYTDPMKAFSGTKTRSKVSPQISQDYSTPPTRMWNPDVIPSPDHQTHINHAPGPRTHPPQGYYGNPAGMVSPPTPGFWNGSAGPPSYQFPSNSPRGGNFPSPAPAFVQGSNHSFNSGQGRGYQFNNSPRPGFGQEQGIGPRFNSSPVPGSGRGGYSGFRQGYNPSPNSVLGRGQGYNSNTTHGPNSGIGRGHWSGQSGGRGRGGRGSSNHISAKERPDLFYNKSMVEDPWKPLKPVIWKTTTVRPPSMNNADSPYSWLPKSIGTKRAKVEDGGPGQTSSQPSLAEYLAASFNEAADHEPSQ